MTLNEILAEIDTSLNQERLMIDHAVTLLARWHEVVKGIRELQEERDQLEDENKNLSNQSYSLVGRSESRWQELLFFATKLALAVGGEDAKTLAAMIDKWNDEDIHGRK